MNKAQRWAVNASNWKPSSAQFDFLISILPICELQQILRFVRIEDRKMALLSRLLQRMLVHSLFEIPYDQIIISRTAHGKPFLVNALQDPHSSFNFNVSHHGDFVVIASEAFSVVGVDVMCHDTRIKEHPREYVEIFKSCFTNHEWSTITSRSSEPKTILQQFYRYWCLKEAYIKAIGTGLGFDLQRIEFSFPGDPIRDRAASIRIDGESRSDWCFILHQLPNDHWVCVATGPPPKIISGLTKLSASPASPKDSNLHSTPFRILTVDELVPLSKRSQFPVI